MYLIPVFLEKIFTSDDVEFYVQKMTIGFYILGWWQIYLPQIATYMLCINLLRVEHIILCSIVARYHVGHICTCFLRNLQSTFIICLKRETFSCEKVPSKSTLINKRFKVDLWGKMNLGSQLSVSLILSG